MKRTGRRRLTSENESAPFPAVDHGATGPAQPERILSLVDNPDRDEFGRRLGGDVQVARRKVPPVLRYAPARVQVAGLNYQRLFEEVEAGGARAPAEDRALAGRQAATGGASRQHLALQSVEELRRIESIIGCDSIFLSRGRKHPRAVISLSEIVRALVVEERGYTEFLDRLGMEPQAKSSPSKNCIERVKRETIRALTRVADEMNIAAEPPP